MVLMLHGFGAPLGLATIAAIGMRLSTLWFAIALGLVAILILELFERKAVARSNTSQKSSLIAPTDSRKSN
jgi:hypothetical protein